MPTLFFILAGLALFVAVWLSVQRPPRQAVAASRAVWHGARATCAAMSSVAGALCVLLGIGSLR